jgi:hypothetical protein
MNTEAIMIGSMVATLIGMALLVPFVAIRRVLRMTRKISGVQELIQRAQQKVMYSELTPVWETGTAIFVQVVLLLLGVGLLCAAGLVYQRNLREAQLLFNEGVTATANWPVILLGGGGLLCMSLSWFPFKKYREARVLDREGVTTTTLLLACFEDSNDDGTSYYVVYELPRLGSICHTVAYKIFKRVNIGDNITIIYLPNNPRIFRPCWR